MRDLYWYKATCTRVVDGDTIDLNVDLGMKIYTVIRVRLARINAPEIHGVLTSSDSYARGIKTTERVKVLIEGKEVLVHTDKDPKDRYGRYIAEVYYYNKEVEINLSTLLLTEGLADEYK